MRTVPVMSTMPAIIGLSIAAHIICKIAEYPMDPHEIDDVKFTSYQRLHFFGNLIEF